MSDEQVEWEAPEAEDGESWPQYRKRATQAARDAEVPTRAAQIATSRGWQRAKEVRELAAAVAKEAVEAEPDTFPWAQERTEDGGEVEVGVPTPEAPVWAGDYLEPNDHTIVVVTSAGPLSLRFGSLNLLQKFLHQARQMLRKGNRALEVNTLDGYFIIPDFCYIKHGRQMEIGHAARKARIEGSRSGGSKPEPHDPRIPRGIKVPKLDADAVDPDPRTLMLAVKGTPRPPTAVRAGADPGSVMLVYDYPREKFFVKKPWAVEDLPPGTRVD